MREIATLLHISRNTIKKVLNDNNIFIRKQNLTSRKYFCDEYYFKTINSADKAYWLGFLMADGYIESKRKYGNQKLGITLSQKDEEHLIKFNTCLKSSYPIKTYIGSGYNEEGLFSKLLITSQNLVNDLKVWNVTENKTKNCKFSYQINQEYYIDFIRGYFDGDGSIYFDSSTKQYRISFTGTYDILSSINNLLEKKNTITPIKNGLYELKYGGNYNVFNILTLLYNSHNEQNLIKLERKYKRYLDLKKYIER